MIPASYLRGTALELTAVAYVVLVGATAIVQQLTDEKGLKHGCQHLRQALSLQKQPFAIGAAGYKNGSFFALCACH